MGKKNYEYFYDLNGLEFRCLKGYHHHNKGKNGVGL